MDHRRQEEAPRRLYADRHTAKTDRPHKQEHAPSFAVFSAVWDLFERASLGMVGPRGYGYVYHTRDGRRQSREAIRAAVGLQDTWTFWANASWQQQQYRLSQQRQYTDLLVDFLTGEMKDKHFTDQDIKQHARNIIEFLKVDCSVDLDQAISLLHNYSAELYSITKPKASGTKRGPASTSGAQATAGVSDRAYSGTQKDRRNDQTASICGRLRAAQADAGGNNAPLSLSSLKFELRPYTRGPALRNQKEALYGGIPDAPLKLESLDFAALDLTFDRTLAAKTYSNIIECSAKFSSYTILSHPGQGKSITLAQVLLRLSVTPGYWTFWSFDAGRPFKCEDSVQCVEGFFKLMREAGCVPKRLIFIFDDLDQRSEADFDAIFDFHSYCEEYSNTKGVEISFLLASNDHDRSITDNVFNLSLDTGDENRLYEAVLTTEPPIAVKAYNTIDELLRACPVIHPWKNDVQSATDFIIQHSDPVREFTPNWFSDLNDETPLVQQALSVIAVTTLLDLALPDHIAHELSAPNQEPATVFEKHGILVARSRRIAYEKMMSATRSTIWPGYVLKSPYYASSLLRRLGKLNEAFVKETIMRMVDCSLARAEQKLPFWKLTDAEFLRHLFHRLAKRKVNRLAGFSDGTRIAAELFVQYGDRLLHILRDEKSATACANWAGTFSYLLVPKKPRQFHGERKTIEQMIYDLCSFVLKENRGIENSQVFVTLLLAIRALCDPYSGEQKVKDLAEAAEQMFSLDRVLDSAQDGSPADAERRSNQVVLSYAKFLRLFPDRKLYEKCRTISNVYDRVERRFLASHFRLDALNLVERAYGVWSKKDDVLTLPRRAHYLREARAATRQRSQLRYKAEVENAISNFEIEYRQAIDDFA